MSKTIDNGPYLAGRLAFFRDFKEGYRTRRWKVYEKTKDALSEGKMIMSGLEFKIRTINKQFIISVSPVDKKNWSKFENHLSRIKNEEFWKMDGYNINLKKSIKELETFAVNRKEQLKDKEKLVISGSFINYNNEYSYRYLIDTIVKPLILYEDFL